MAPTEVLAEQHYFGLRELIANAGLTVPEPDSLMGERPVTVAILNFLEFGFAPTLAAVSILTLVIPLILVAVMERFVRIGDFLYGSNARNG